MSRPPADRSCPWCHEQIIGEPERVLRVDGVDRIAHAACEGMQPRSCAWCGGGGGPVVRKRDLFGVHRVHVACVEEWRADLLDRPTDGRRQ